MNPAITQMLASYSLLAPEDYSQALKEILQQIALLGLWRARFYEYASFYGGSALRIFYGLPRFSEDLDFSLIQNHSSFQIEPYLKAIEREINSFGFSFSVEKKEMKENKTIESAFLKGNTRINLLNVQADEKIIEGFPANQKIKIKFEIDIFPPPEGSHEVKTLLVPIPFQVKVFTLPDLFAGKLHAVLCRQWQARVKGRDFFDLIWFIGKNVPCHLAYLKEKMVQTAHWLAEDNLTRESLLKLLENKITQADIHKAKEDIKPFIKDQQSLSLWAPDFFLQVIQRIKIIK